MEWRHVRERTLLFEQKNINREIVAGQKTGRPPRTTPLWGALRDDLLAWHSTRKAKRAGVPQPAGQSIQRDPLGQLVNADLEAAAGQAGGNEPPYGLRHSYASLRIHEGASIPELAEELGHSPHMTLTTYAHVIHELRGAPRLPAADEVAKARREVNQRGAQLALAEPLG